MGFFDKLKRVKNYFTGGGAEIEIEFLGESYLHQPFNIKVVVKIGEQEIDCNEVYLVVKNTEHVEVQARTYNSNGQSTSRVFHNAATLYEDRISFAQDVILEANQIYDFEATLHFPPEVVPSFQGINSKLVWTLQAFIDMRGNDPNSELVEFEPLV